MIPPNVELVAACAMGVKTIRPGPRSFTTILIEELRALLKEFKKAKIQDVVNGLVSRKANCRETPVRFSGLSKTRGTICLEPLIPPSPSAQTKQEKAMMKLKISLRDTLNDSVVSEMTTWLSHLAPRQVSKLTVEDVVSSTGSVYDYIFDSDRGSAPTGFQHLSERGKNEIWTAWDELKAHLAVAAAHSKHPASYTDQSCERLDKSLSMQGEPLKCLQKVETSLLSLQGLIERHVMALPDLYKDKDALLTAIEDIALRDMGFLPVLELRLKARFPSDFDSAMKARYDAKSTSTRSEIISTLVEENVDGLGPVLVEYKTYGESDATTDNIAQSEQRMKHLTSLLKSACSPDFRTLQCTRWFHQADNNRFGLIFKMPVTHGGFITLRDAIIRCDRTRRPTLGQRYSIARMIGNALLRWHRAHWVHQGIASYNIVFFIRDGMIDYCNPYLCGFEYARPSGDPSTSRRVKRFELNVYRYPTRQGVPTKYHTKIHDIYSYGVLLLEVGVWELVEECFDGMDKMSLSPFKMQEHLIEESKLRLGHYAGGAYQKAADRCLSLDLAVKQDDAVESQLAMNFEDYVLRKIPSGHMID